MMRFTPYPKLRKEFREYWRIYGGFKKLISSFYFHLAVLVSIFTWSFWSKEDWWQQPLSVLPNLVGFTLGGYAMLMAFGDDDFRRKLLGPGKNNKTSPFMGVNGTFVHFLVVQISAIIIAIIANARPIQSMPTIVIDFLIDTVPFFSDLRYVFGKAFWWFGYTTFLYAITLTIAATFGIFKVAGWYDKSVPPRTELASTNQNSANTDSHSGPSKDSK